MIICYPGAMSTSLPRSNFKHVYLFLELSGTFYCKIIVNINNEHAQDYSCPEQLLCFVQIRKVALARQNTRCCTTGNPRLKVALAEQNTHVNSCRHQTVYRGKVDPGVSELPRDHVNKP